MILRQQGGSWGLEHMRGSHLRVVLPPALAAELKGGLAAAGTGRGANYSKEEKAFIATVAAGKPDPGNFCPDTFNHRHFKKLLSEKDYHQVTRDLTRNYINHLEAEVLKSGGPVEVARALRERGVLVVPVKERGQVKDYKIQYYLYPETDLLITPGLRKGLLTAGYNQTPPALTDRYKIVVKIRQGMDRKDTKPLQKALSYLEGRNPELYSSLKKDLEFLGKELQGAGGINRESLTGHMGQLVIDRLERYPTDNLLKQSAPEQDKGQQKDYGRDKLITGALPASRDMHSSDSSDVGGHPVNQKEIPKTYLIINRVSMLGFLTLSTT